MKTDRINVYALPHKGLRNAMSQVSFLAGNTDFTNPYELESLKILMAELVYLLEQHAHTEDTVMLPLLEEKLPGSTAENAEEHEMLDAMVSRLAHQIEKIEAYGDASKLEDFYANFSDFHSKYLAHMQMEERVVQQKFWDHFTDEELLDVHHKIVASFSPEKIMRWFRFIIPALNPQERMASLAKIKQHAPAEFFEAIMSMLEKEMSAYSLAQLREMLEESLLPH
jgi:hypothetical protein